MSSEETDVDLSVAAEVTAVGSMPDEGAAIQNFAQITEGDELVKRRDAEKAIKKARQQERQRILDKIKDKRQEFNNGRDSEYPQKVLTELLEEVEEA